MTSRMRGGIDTRNIESGISLCSAARKQTDDELDKKEMARGQIRLLLTEMPLLQKLTPGKRIVFRHRVAPLVWYLSPRRFLFSTNLAPDLQESFPIAATPKHRCKVS